MTEIIWQQYYFVGTPSLQSSEAAWLNVTTAFTEHQVFEGRIVHSSWELGGFQTYQLKTIEERRRRWTTWSQLTSDYKENQHLDRGRTFGAQEQGETSLDFERTENSSDQSSHNRS